MSEERRQRGPAVRNLLVGLLESANLLGVVTATALASRLNVAAAGFLFLIVILFVASHRSLYVSSVASVGAMLCYNFFFIPPTGTFTVEDPANWTALAAFLLTSLVANRLLSRERRQAEEARASRAEVEALYQLSVDLLRATSGPAAIAEAFVRVLARVGAASGGIVLFGASPQHQRVLVWSGVPLSDEVEDVAAGVGRHRRMTEIASRFGRDVYLPLLVGERIYGVLVVRGSNATPNALESIATLIAFAIEREWFVDERARLQALHESNDLKTSLLQAVSHDLNSPLTVLTVETEALSRSLPKDEHLRVIREQLAQLHRRIGNLLSLARVEAGIIRPSTEPTPVADLLRSVRENVGIITHSRTIQTTVADDTPDVVVDPSLGLEILVNLVENAHRPSPTGALIELRASRSSEDGGRVWVEVLDRGAGVPADQQRVLRTAGLADADRRGLGVQIARTLATVSGGTVEWFPRDGGGTISRLELPAALVGGSP